MNNKDLGQSASVPFPDFFLVNIPLWLFALLAMGGLALFASLTFPRILIALVPFVWGTSGVVMMAYDYHSRKRLLFLRLRSRPLPSKGSALYRSLCSTPCGLSLLLAAKTARKRAATEL